MKVRSKKTEAQRNVSTRTGKNARINPNLLVLENSSIITFTLLFHRIFVNSSQGLDLRGGGNIPDSAFRKNSSGGNLRGGGLGHATDCIRITLSRKISCT